MLKDSKAFSGFSVGDLQQAKRFYGETLGLEIAERPGGLELRITNSAPIFIYPKPDHTPATFTILHFPVEDAESAVEELTKRGIRFERYDEADFKTGEKGIYHGPGHKMAWFKDPAGNVLNLVEME